MACCANCFGDRGLKSIIPSRSTERGKCDYCETEDAVLVEPAALVEYFAMLISIYQPDANGRPLVEWLKQDWLLFDHPRMDGPRCELLLANILADVQIVRQRFSPAPYFQNDRLARWETLKSELRYQNRYFPEGQIDKERLEELFNSHLTTIELPKLWYRARLQIDENPFGPDMMGAPPARVVSHGRANPPGIPYLYLNSDPAGAIAELRPHTGEIACVATFEIPSIRAADLRTPRKTVSPFVLEDEIQIGLLRGDIDFLEALGEELTVPVLPQGAAIDYVPSQYLCEFIKKCEYEAVAYRSSVSDGINLALFSAAGLMPKEVVQYKVESVSVVVKAGAK